MIILITGGSSGLGYSILESLSKDKNNFIFATFNNNYPTEFENIDNISLIKTNFKEPTSVIKLLRKIKNLDCLINNYHSGYIFKHTSRFTSAEVLNSFSTNIAPLIDLNNYFIKIMKKKKNGLIISILSELTSTSPSLGMGIYTAEKFYLKTLSDHWSKELKSYNISSVSISPKMLNTKFNHSIDTRYLDIIKKQGGFSKISNVTKQIKKTISNPQSFNGKNIIV